MPCEFECQDCKIHVYDAISDTPLDPPLCAACLFISHIKDPVERDQIRKALHIDD